MKKLAILFSIAFLSFYYACKTGDRKEEFTTIKINPDTLFIKRLSIGDSITRDFNIQNTGKIDLKIANVSPACNCSVASFDSTAIPPNETTNIRITYTNSSDMGDLLKIFVLEANTKEKLIPLYLATKED